MIEIVFFIFILSFIFLSFGALFSKIIFEKILFINNIGNHIIILIIILGLFNGNENFIDIAFIYALLSFITNIAILKKYKVKKF
jgi:multicomponent Na+:H+ antiporter subunit F